MTAARFIVIAACSIIRLERHLLDSMAAAGTALIAARRLDPLAAALHQDRLSRQSQRPTRFGGHACAGRGLISFVWSYEWEGDKCLWRTAVAAFDDVTAGLQHAVSVLVDHSQRLRIRGKVRSAALPRRDSSEPLEPEELPQWHVRVGGHVRGPHNECKRDNITGHRASICRNHRVLDRKLGELLGSGRQHHVSAIVRGRVGPGEGEVGIG